MSSSEARFDPPSGLGIRIFPGRQSETIDNLTFYDCAGQAWIAPEGTITDGASIPQIFLSFIGDRSDPALFFAAVIHDAYCGKRNKAGASYHAANWHDTHRMFYEACRLCGTPLVKANLMYAAVRLGGPRWSTTGESFNDLSELPARQLMDEMSYCKDWIEARAESLNLDDVDQWMIEREEALLSG